MASLPITALPAPRPTVLPAVAPKVVPVERVSIVPEARLSALEWSIVALAERDSLASLREPGRIAAALESLFGLARPNRLADPRLEALRRVSVHVWRNRWKVPGDELRAFTDAGFTLDQYELIQLSIAKSHQQSRRRRGSYRR
ncbi:MULTISPECIES: hypothetical protein [Sphingomonas]|uniref:hypothetical protein n=1 Tax=Sphingomonas TaxID=13687 RepID=UPI000DEF7011|nr:MULTISPECIES: hypothetical protein [Sphingomonas]